MKIKKVNGEVVDIKAVMTKEIWVRWKDIKPIIEELQGELARHQEAIENEHVGCSDYSLMTKDS